MVYHLCNFYRLNKHNLIPLYIIYTYIKLSRNSIQRIHGSTTKASIKSNFFPEMSRKTIKYRVQILTIISLSDLNWLVLRKHWHFLSGSRKRRVYSLNYIEDIDLRTRVKNEIEIRSRVEILRFNWTNRGSRNRLPFSSLLYLSEFLYWLRPSSRLMLFHTAH